MKKKFSVLIKNKINSFNKKISVDPDKSISHRCYVIASQCLGVSKIKALDDLFTIDTLGFRGDALASIASVSEVNILSANGTGDGFEMSILNGESGDLQPAPNLKGTSITIRNLFYNTPARKKFLKSPRAEFRKVVEMVRRFSLGYPECSFNLISDGRDILKLKKEDLEDRIVNVMDPAYRDQLLPINFTKGDYSIVGYLGNLNLLRSRPGEQYIFLNNRFILNRLMNSSAYQAYGSLLKRGEYPFYSINISIPHDQVDVNVHPMKTEVRFKDEWRMFHILKSSFEESLEPILKTIPDLEKPNFSNQFNFDTIPNRYSDPESSQKNLLFEDNNNADNSFEPAVDRAKSYVSRLASRDDPDSNQVNLNNIWQVHSKYIVSPISSGLVIIDQHVAHERILFEEAMKSFDSMPMTAQTLLFPEIMEFSSDDFSVLLDVLTYLEKMGFRMSQFGENTIMVEAIPSEMSWGNEKKIIREMLDNYLETQKEYSSFQEALAASFSCKAAIKAGDVLNVDEMRELVNRLFGTKHPYYCPHGRPIIVQLSMEELDRRFERI